MGGTGVRVSVTLSEEDKTLPPRGLQARMGLERQTGGVSVMPHGAIVLCILGSPGWDKGVGALCEVIRL